LPFANELVDTTAEGGKAEALGDRVVEDGAVDGRLSQVVLTESDDRADTEVLGDLPDTADRVAGQLKLAGVDEPQHSEHSDRRVLSKVYRDDLTRRELAELLNEVLAVRSQYHLHPRTCAV